MEGITYQQVQRAMQTMPDLVDVIRQFAPLLIEMAAEGRCVERDLCRPRAVGFHWSRGN